MPQLNVFGKGESCNKAEFLTTGMIFLKFSNYNPSLIFEAQSPHNHCHAIFQQYALIPTPRGIQGLTEIKSSTTNTTFLFCKIFLKFRLSLRFQPPK
jgi:hypothetical protein